MATEDLAVELLAGSRRALAKAITLVESTHTRDREHSRTLLSSLPSTAMPTLRLGVTGPPGVGKSTLIASLASALAKGGARPAVLSYDPASDVGGSVLADKTRMQDLLTYPEVYVRPSPTTAAGGGIGRGAYQAILLCEAAGHAPVLVETVGVGQGELGVFEVADVTMLLVQPQAGDELQAMKRGVLGHADLVVVTKADGVLAEGAEKARSEIQGVLPWFVATKRSRPVLSVSALTAQGVNDVLAAVEQRFSELVSAGELPRARGARQRARFTRVLTSQLLEHFNRDPAVAPRLPGITERVERGELLVEDAVAELLGTA